jgi:secernin
MCDTFYASRAMSRDGRAYFAKNSDRHPLEPQALCIVPGSGDGGLSFVLSKPSWMAGGEMGMNEKGVAIGNEAVFSRIKPRPDGVLGMDILRSALSASRDARSAVDFICSFTEGHDQGGNGAYKGKLVYNNSYLVASREEAYVVETAGRRWAWQAIEGYGAISNAYSIEGGYQDIDARTRDEMAQRRPGARRSGDAPRSARAAPARAASWRARVEDPFYLLFTRGDVRRNRALDYLRSASRSIDLEAMLALLRSHGSFDPRRGRRGNMKSTCIHPGAFPVDSATTASLAVEYLPQAEGRERGIVWFTGTSYPCLSLYKPILLSEGRFVPLWSGYDYGEGSTEAYAFWERQRKKVAEGKAWARSQDADFAERLTEAQARLASAAQRAALGGDIESSREEVGAAVAEWARCSGLA